MHGCIRWATTVASGDSEAIEVSGVTTSIGECEKALQMNDSSSSGSSRTENGALWKVRGSAGARDVARGERSAMLDLARKTHFHWCDCVSLRR
jgi:hypothetical protein